MLVFHISFIWGGLFSGLYEPGTKDRLLFQGRNLPEHMDENHALTPEDVPAAVWNC